MKTRNNVIQKLAGTLRGLILTTYEHALLLVFSAAEYVTPVWLNSAQSETVDKNPFWHPEAYCSKVAYSLPILHPQISEENNIYSLLKLLKTSFSLQTTTFEGFKVSKVLREENL